MNHVIKMIQLQDTIKLRDQNWNCISSPQSIHIIHSMRSLIKEKDTKKNQSIKKTFDQGVKQEPWQNQHQTQAVQLTETHPSQTILLYN